MKDVGLLIGRGVVGLLVAGHGAQKLFGWFEGPGLRTWTTVTEDRLGMRPAAIWAPLGGLGEFGGGLLTALGFLNPLGPIALGSMMIAAAYKGHWGKPIWAAKGGAELAVSFLASAVVAGTHGPGRYSLDTLLGVRVPRWVTALALLGSAGLLAETIRPTLTPRLSRTSTSAAPQSECTPAQETGTPEA
jgi:putative oxidoreductase